MSIACVASVTYTTMIVHRGVATPVIAACNPYPRKPPDPWRRATRPTCPTSGKPFDLTPDDEKQLVDRALADAISKPRLIFDWGFVDALDEIPLFDERAAFDGRSSDREPIVAPGYVPRTDPEKPFVGLDGVWFDGHCAKVALGASPGVQYHLGGCITDLLYEKRDGGWALVGRLGGACA